ncbi:MAG: sugar phosphate nucleotidyltransferase [Bacteroidales bacterium]
MIIKKAVITAAARGERLYPVADTVQKAMLPMVDVDGINKPVIQIIAEEALASGVEELCIICAPGDEARYLEQFSSLRQTLVQEYRHSEWAQIQAGRIKDLLERLTFRVQEEARGYGHAVYQANNFVNNQPFLLLLGDYLYVSDLPGVRCAQQMIQLAASEDCSVSAVNQMNEYLISRYGTLTGKSVSGKPGVYQIEKIIEKPSISRAELELQTPGLRAGYYLCFFGMQVFKPVLFNILEEDLRQNKASGEKTQLTPALQRLAEQDKYLAMEMRGNRYDTSKRLGLMQAQLALSLAGPMKEEVLGSMLQIVAESNRRTKGESR